MPIPQEMTVQAIAKGEARCGDIRGSSYKLITRLLVVGGPSSHNGPMDIVPWR